MIIESVSSNVVELNIFILEFSEISTILRFTHPEKDELLIISTQDGIKMLLIVLSKKA